ncbi:hypothetical protein ElyMa_000881400 [Elysia marginata]|uniref:Uncharacterized protein n=1 Tax=Elysia marginata TaxID=1093978 RepID=A0AAV4H8E0_9GAST|nr:hypothetical protein ElyMa_000881400 [Elysia marginata]
MDPPQTTGDFRPSCVRGGHNKTTGYPTRKTIKIMQRTAQGLKLKKSEFGRVLRKPEIDMWLSKILIRKKRSVSGFQTASIENRGNITLLNNNTLTAVEIYRSRPDGGTKYQDTECLGIEIILPTSPLVQHLFNPGQMSFALNQS